MKPSRRYLVSTLAQRIEAITGPKEIHVHSDGRCLDFFFPVPYQSIRQLEPATAMAYEASLWKALEQGGGICVYRPHPLKILCERNWIKVQEVFGLKVGPLGIEPIDSHGLRALFENEQGPTEQALGSHFLFRQFPA